MKHKRSDPMCDPWDSRGDEKMQFLFLLLFIFAKQRLIFLQILTQIFM